VKVKILSSFPKQTLNVDKVWFSSDLHLNHQAVINFGRQFDSVSHMNDYILNETNKVVRENDLLVLCGDTMMGEKDYIQFLNSLICDNIIMLFGNHCNRSKMQSALIECDKLIYIGDYVELNVEKQIICCSHFPQFNWNYQDDGAISLHGHLHADENAVVKEIHKYKSLDVGIDNYYKLFGEYSLFSFEKVCELLRDKLIIGRHG
jgi:calcineurin-like phosphoesterase family protein